MSKTCLDLFETLSVASSDDGQVTPSHTTIVDGDFNENINPVEAIPHPGSIFIIRHRKSGKVITLQDGELQLCEGFSARGGFQWCCVEKDRWLGFRNCVSGTYIGHNDRKKFVAKVAHHLRFEFFCARANPTGGYELLTRHGDELWSMDVGKDGNSLVEVKGVGSLWDFLKV
ncbi:Fc.00g055130.m01.CDS01 [Cosmosporella sp. VM-42]